MKTHKPIPAQLGAKKLGQRFQKALLFAAQKHAGQARKASTIPYMAHLMGVAALVMGVAPLLWLNHRHDADPQEACSVDLSMRSDARRIGPDAQEPDGSLH